MIATLSEESFIKLLENTKLLRNDKTSILKYRILVSAFAVYNAVKTLKEVGRKLEIAKFELCFVSLSQLGETIKSTLEGGSEITAPLIFYNPYIPYSDTLKGCFENSNPLYESKLLEELERIDRIINSFEQQKNITLVLLKCIEFQVKSYGSAKPV